MQRFAKLTDAQAGASTASIYVNVGAVQMLQRFDSAVPPHTKVFFSVPALLQRDKGQPDGVLWVKETPDEIFELVGASG